MSKKARIKKPHGDRITKRRHTLQRKITRLQKRVSDFPSDIAANIALSQAEYDLTKVH